MWRFRLRGLGVISGTFIILVLICYLGGFWMIVGIRE